MPAILIDPRSEADLRWGLSRYGYRKTAPGLLEEAPRARNSLMSLLFTPAPPGALSKRIRGDGGRFPFPGTRVMPVGYR